MSPPISQNHDPHQCLNFLLVEIDEPELLRVTRQEQEVAKGTYSDLHVYQVTCLQIGITKVTFVVGNNPSATNT
jgi:hypothetical protein